MKSKVYISANPGQVAPLYGVLVYFETFEDGAVGDRAVDDNIVDGAGNVYKLTNIDAGGPSGAGSTYTCIVEDEDVTGAAPLEGYAYFYTPTSGGLSDLPLIDVSQMQNPQHGVVRRDNSEVVDAVVVGGGGGGISEVAFNGTPVDSGGETITGLNFNSALNMFPITFDSTTGNMDIRFAQISINSLANTPSNVTENAVLLGGAAESTSWATGISSFSITTLSSTTAGITTANISTANISNANITGTLKVGTDFTIVGNLITFDGSDAGDAVTINGSDAALTMTGQSIAADMRDLNFRYFEDVQFQGQATDADMGTFEVTGYADMRFSGRATGHGTSDRFQIENFYSVEIESSGAGGIEIDTNNNGPIVLDAGGTNNIVLDADSVVIPNNSTNVANLTVGCMTFYNNQLNVYNGSTWLSVTLT